MQPFAPDRIRPWLRATPLFALLGMLLVSAARPASAQGGRNGKTPNTAISPVDVTITALNGYHCLGWGESWTATYSTGATGQPSYTWKVDGAVVQGQTGPSLPYMFGTAGSHTIECDVQVGVSSGAQTLTWPVYDCGDSGAGPSLSVTASSWDPCKGSSTCFTVRPLGFGGYSGTYTVAWDFGDGSAGVVGPLTACHDYLATGPFDGTVRVTAGSQTASQTLHVVVNDCGGIQNGGGGNGGIMTRGPSPGGGGNEPHLCVASGGGVSAIIGLFCGNLLVFVADPVRTRGFPLVNNISVNSQWVEGNRPMGRASFTYDMHVGTQQVWQSCQSSTHWALVDADGTRLEFGPASGAPAAGPGVFSTLTQNGGGFVLSSAGPPGDLRDAGDFTYYFDTNGRLTQLVDPAGNAQVLTYANGTQLASVLDVNTGKQLTFTWSGGYITEIVQNGGAEVTDITYQGGGPPSISIKTAAGGAVLTSVSFTYNGDGSVAGFSRDGDPSSAVTMGYVGAPSSDCATTVPMANVAGPLALMTHIDWQQPAVAGAYYGVYVTNAQGGTVRYDFDASGGLYRAVLPPLSGSAQSTIYTYSWTSGRELSNVTDGFVTDGFGYGANGALASATDGLSNAWTWNYGGSCQWI